MRRLILLFCLVVAACSAKPKTLPHSFRPATAPIYSNAVFAVERVAGRWDQVAAFSGPDPLGCNSGYAAFLPLDGTLQVDYQLCLAGQMVTGGGAIVPTGPGRFSIKGDTGIGQDWWVLWVDESYRTLAIGNPSGTFGFILNRGQALPSDRMIAAREVFDFNGYDVRKLVLFPAQ